MKRVDDIFKMLQPIAGYDLRTAGSDAAVVRLNEFPVVQNLKTLISGVKPAFAPTGRSKQKSNHNAPERGTRVGARDRGPYHPPARNAVRGSALQRRTTNRGNNSGYRDLRLCRNRASFRDVRSGRRQGRPGHSDHETEPSPLREHEWPSASPKHRSTGRQDANTAAAIRPWASRGQLRSWKHRVPVACGHSPFQRRFEACCISKIP